MDPSNQHDPLIVRIRAGADGKFTIECIENHLSPNPHIHVYTLTEWFQHLRRIEVYFIERARARDRAAPHGSSPAR